MRKIQAYVDQINEELESAADYAEAYIENRAMGEMSLAGMYKTMAAQELEHALNIHKLAQRDIEAVKKVYTAPVEMARGWDEAHTHYVNEYDRIKGMLND